MQFGQLRFYLSKLPQGAGIDPTVLSTIINDRYMQIVNAYHWSRLTAKGSITTVELYETGTIAVEEGSASITGTDTVWTAAMTGRKIRIAGRDETYVFTYVSTTTGTLDVPYEGEDDDEASYKIFQNTYALPSDVSVLESITIPNTDNELDQRGQEYLDEIDPNRLLFGRPYIYAPYEDSSDLISQLELYPIPEVAETYPVRYQRRVDRIDGNSTAEEFLAWVNTVCLTAGCEADLYSLKGDYTGYQIKEAKFQMLLGDMKNQDARRQVPVTLQMDEIYTQHRWERATGNSRRSRRWWQLHNSDET